MSDLVKVYWQSFLDACPEFRATRPELIVDEFGDSPELADRLVELISSGTKTATCSALAEYEATGEALPQAGQFAVVVNSRREPVCIRETTEVEIKRFCDVDERFAYEEGEDGRTLASWQREHERFFSRLMPELGLEFSAEMLLVCERFRVVCRATGNAAI